MAYSVKGTSVAPSSKPGDAKAIRTLIADDSLQMRNQMDRLLQRIDKVEVVCKAEDGKQAIDQAVLLQPDLVLLDLEMPRMGGLEAARQVRARFPKIRVLVVSGHDSAVVRQAVEDSGADAFIPKGRLPQDLASEIHRLFPK